MDDTERQPGRGRRRWLAYGIGAGVALAVALAAAVWVRGASAGSEPTEERIQVKTVAITRTDLSTSHALRGSLGFGTARPIKGGREGLVTWLPAMGTVINRGQSLYRVNDEAVPLFFGSPPLYRTLSEGGTVGRDVAMVARNLKALGYSIGRQPKPGEVIIQGAQSGPGQSGPGQSGPGQSGQGSTGQGSTGQGGQTQGTPGATSVRVRVREGDGVLTAALIRAIKKWQRDHDLPEDGRIDVGDVAVVAGPVRVESVAIAVGDSAEGHILSVTPTRKVVTVQAGVGEAGSLKKGAATTVRLPDGTETPGKVSAIGMVAQAGTEQAGSDSVASLTVIVTLDEPAAVKRLDGADVQVNVTGETRTGVLAVPVTALLALHEGGYAVQLEDGRLLAVETGLFARGMVEITGAGLREGLLVVTTS